jgi:ubiquinone/menaquinone biosynthesis C-methylase UbiE
MANSGYADVFNATSTSFTKVTPRVWGPAGTALAFQLQFQPGEAVLDVCCGTGASAIPAATAVGPDGLVHAIDLADDLLEEGRLTVSDWALQNIDFVAADATAWEPPSSVPAAGYDVVSSSYGVFFLPHMDSAAARLTRLVRDGGRIGFTVWREHALEGFAGPYFEVLSKYLPGPPPAQAMESPREANGRIDTAEKFASWLDSLGTESVVVKELSNLLPATDEFTWDLVLGSGLRAPLASLDEATIARVRQEFLELLADRGVHTLDMGTLIGTAVVRR